MEAISMKRFFYSAICFGVATLVFHGCITYVQMEVNPGFSGTISSKDATFMPLNSPEAEKPRWEVGYKWVYKWERPDSSGTLTRKIVRTDTFDNVPCYVFKARTTEYFYTRDVLGLLGAKRRGKVVARRDAPFQPLAWPLYVGRTWRNKFTEERPQEESSSDIDIEVVVVNQEEVTVPAGKFRAFKIEVYNSGSKELAAEYWYSPKVRWFVKRINYTGRGSRPREERLISYSIE